MAMARAEENHRDERRIALLNRALDRVGQGLRVGYERKLQDFLDAMALAAIDSWCKTWVRLPAVRRVTVDAVLFGDGSCPP
jgi:hypothetical protein